jgi:flagellar protein FliO/FliZ
MNEGSLADTMVRLVVSLATVLTLMILLARYLRHRQNGGGLGKLAAKGRKAVPPLQVLTRQGLSRGSSVAVVRVSGQLLLLGVTDSTVSLLGELNDEEEPDLAPPAPESSTLSPDLADIPAGAPSVVEYLRQLTARRG